MKERDVIMSEVLLRHPSVAEVAIDHDRSGPVAVIVLDQGASAEQLLSWLSRSGLDAPRRIEFRRALPAVRSLAA